MAFRLEYQLDQSLDSAQFHIHFFIAVMANDLLENRREDLTLVISKVPLKGFVSEHGVANFLNVPYGTVPLRFRTAVPLLISAHKSSLDVSQYGPRCPQKTDRLQDMMAHVFEKVTASAAPDETNCLHLNIYTPPAATYSTATSKLPVFVWIHGGAFNHGDNSSQFGMPDICSKYT
jgi:carboxylesterase type B